MDDDKDNETSKVESDDPDVSEDKPRLEPTGTDEQPVEEKGSEEEKAEDDTELDCLALFAQQLNDKDRMFLYDKAVRLKRKGSYTHALQCLLCCLQGLKERNRFPVLPECLHHIAEIYSKQEDYETAIQFAQAEKLYYETALITINRDEKPEPWVDNIQFGKLAGDNIATSQEQNVTRATSEEAKKADEYEKLAHMCLKQKNPQLALDYCAKAVKLQQACYGERHPITLQTLDLFTLIYAEMGKQQYKAAMEKFAAAQEQEEQDKQLKQQTKQTKQQTEQTQQQTKQTLQQDIKQKSEKELTGSNDKPVDGDKAIGDGENQQENQQDDQSTQNSYTVQLELTSSWAVLIYFIITALLALVLTATLCYFTQTDISSTYSYVVTRMKFYYYYYFVKKQPSGNQYF